MYSISFFMMVFGPYVGSMVVEFDPVALVVSATRRDVRQARKADQERAEQRLEGQCSASKERG
jgi:hypothetical protein